MPPQDAEMARWFAEHVQAHEPILRGYLHSLADAGDIDDIIQESYIRLLRARERGPIESPRGLLFATARNVARDILRRRATARAFAGAETDAAHVLDSAPGVADTVSRAHEADLLMAAIRGLPERCREILVLRKFENLSHREIARKLRISENTVQAQLTKALHACEKFFARKGALPRD